MIKKKGQIAALRYISRDFRSLLEMLLVEYIICILETLLVECIVIAFMMRDAMPLLESKHVYGLR